jgi:hypothetical protein
MKYIFLGPMKNFLKWIHCILSSFMLFKSVSFSREQACFCRRNCGYNPSLLPILPFCQNVWNYGERSVFSLFSLFYKLQILVWLMNHWRCTCEIFNETRSYAYLRILHATCSHVNSTTLWNCNRQLSIARIYIYGNYTQ